jgi:alkylation response protein AidB-like acyl-CoA dehydrogenase
VSLFLVDTALPGFHRGRVLDKVGQPESDTAELFFDDVRVPGDAVLGEVGSGFVAMMQRLPQERIGVAVCAVAHARQILDETISYARERVAFGRPVGSFQYNKFRLAEMATEIEVSEAFVDRCVEQHLRRELDADRAAMAKCWATEVQGRVIDACVQLYGGYGYMNEYRVARAWKDARVNRIWAGSNEIMKELIGRGLGL